MSAAPGEMSSDAQKRNNLRPQLVSGKSRHTGKPLKVNLTQEKLVRLLDVHFVCQVPGQSACLQDALRMITTGKVFITCPGAKKEKEQEPRTLSELEVQVIKEWYDAKDQKLVGSCSGEASSRAQAAAQTQKWLRSGASKAGGGRTRAGAVPNRVCACCGSAMDMNQAWWDHARASDYCYICGREPLCRSCANFERPARMDVRWAVLTGTAHEAAEEGRERRTVAGVERTWDVVCCFCLGQLGEEHHHPEQPQPIHPQARPEGWVLCEWCTLVRETLRDGSHTWIHECPHCDSNTWRARVGRNGTSAGSNFSHKIRQNGFI